MPIIQSGKLHHHIKKQNLRIQELSAADKTAAGSFFFLKRSVINLSLSHILEVEEDRTMRTVEKIWEMIGQSGKNIEEIRVRAGRPVLIRREGKEEQMEFEADPAMIRELLAMISHHSLYAFEDEMRQGFLTITGGHRIGIAGKAVLEEKEIRSLKEISALNIRISHSCRGCADRIISGLYKQGELLNTLFVSPPGAGKTTMLREVIRLVSDGNTFGKGATVSVVDERSELASCYRGVQQIDLGMRTDVMDGCPKALGMLMMIRSMSPEVMAVDEIGTMEDLEALRDVMKCGCKILATVHGADVEDLKKKRVLREMAEEKMFERYVVLKRIPSPGTVDGIYDGEMQRLKGDWA